MELWFIPDLLGFYPYRILRRLRHTSANLRGDAEMGCNERPRSISKRAVINVRDVTSRCF